MTHDTHNGVPIPNNYGAVQNVGRFQAYAESAYTGNGR